ncbi:MAG: NAD-dependent epimerase/dehydratase family protein [Thermoleophilaceae bacterium]
MSFAIGEGRVRPRLAVLGADGFIGSRLVHAALAAGADVTAICVRPPWRLEEIDVAPFRIVRVPGGRWWDGAGLATVAGALADADALALLAYEAPEVRQGAAALEHEREVNVGGAASVAEIAADLGVRVLFASSADVYGSPGDAPVTEHAEPQPVTPYGIAKLEAERLVDAACRRARGAVSARLSTVFGPHEHAARAIPSFIRAMAAGERPVVHGEGDDLRDYAYVDDVAHALARCALDPFAFSAVAPVINIGSGTGRTTLQVLEAVAGVMGTAPIARHVPSDRPTSKLTLDVTRARCGVGFDNFTSFEEGIRIEAAALVTGLPRAVAPSLELNARAPLRNRATRV